MNKIANLDDVPIGLAIIGERIEAWEPPGGIEAETKCDVGVRPLQIVVAMKPAGRAFPIAKEYFYVKDKAEQVAVRLDFTAKGLLRAVDPESDAMIAERQREEDAALRAEVVELRAENTRLREMLGEIFAEKEAAP